jgi:putative Holliday junction resolvase
VLALDLGDARIGVALSDPLGLTAQPLRTLASRGARNDLRCVAELVEAHDVGTVVIGWPLHLSGREGDRAERAKAWARRLAGRLPGVDVQLWDERLTTVEAERAMLEADVSRERRRANVDRLAATLILQSFLDARAAEAERG